MNYTLFDDNNRSKLLPFTHTRPVADIRCGILTMRERWELHLEQSTGSLTEEYLQPAFPVNSGTDNVYINGAVFGNLHMVRAIQQLPQGQILIKGDTIIAAHVTDRFNSIKGFIEHIKNLPEQYYDGEVYALQNVWDIFSFADRAIRDDFALLTMSRKSAPVPAHVTVTGANNLFIEEGANIYAGCIINATTGPVFIGKETEILEGTMIRGPLAVCDHGVIKMGGKVYGATVVGPGCKVGGEINNVVFFANSNKSHDGYLGNAVIGEWCNLGADTNCSNLKNNYDEVKIWSEALDNMVATGLTFCGLLMGDHSKCGINTMFNTGTVVGVSCNIFGGGFPDKFVRSFTWGACDAADTTTYRLDRAIDTANKMMGRRGKSLSDAEIAVFQHIYDKATEDKS